MNNASSFDCARVLAVKVWPPVAFTDMYGNNKTRNSDFVKYKCDKESSLWRCSLGVCSSPLIILDGFNSRENWSDKNSVEHAQDFPFSLIARCCGILLYDEDPDRNTDL